MQPERHLDTQIWRVGAGPRLLLLHGEFGDATTYWGPVAETLAQRFEVVLPDLPGFGKTAPLPDYRAQSYLVWLKRLIDELEREPAVRTGELPVEPIVLGGAGYGATIARLFAARHPSLVRRLILAGGGTLPRRSPLRDVISRLVGFSRSTTYPRRACSPDDLFVYSRHLGTADFRRSFDRATPAARRVLQALDETPLPPALSPTCTTLLVWGHDDRVYPLPAQAEIAEELKDTRQVEIFEAGHLVMLEQPHRFTAHVMDFLGKVSAGDRDGA